MLMTRSSAFFIHSICLSNNRPAKSVFILSFDCIRLQLGTRMSGTELCCQGRNESPEAMNLPN